MTSPVMTSTTIDLSMTSDEGRAQQGAATARADARGAVLGGPKAILRAEGAVVLVGALAAFRALDGGWGTLAALFLAPDLALLGYLAGPRVGALLYNATHSYLGPAILGGLALGLALPREALFTALIWAAHIGFDRTLGYGLKYARRFGATHLGSVGQR